MTPRRFMRFPRNPARGSRARDELLAIAADKAHRSAIFGTTIGSIRIAMTQVRGSDVGSQPQTFPARGRRSSLPAMSRACDLSLAPPVVMASSAGERSRFWGLSSPNRVPCVRFPYPISIYQ